MNPTFIDLFSGAGGLSLGLIQAGWKPLLALDYWDDAISSYDSNMPDHPNICEDVNAFDTDMAKELLPEQPTWIVGGPPCQGFSTVGKRIRKDPRNRLVEEFIRVIAELTPKGVLIENVIGLKDMKFVGAIVERLGRIGYRVTPVILKAADYGVPQLRRRIFFIGDRTGRLFVPPPSTCSEGQEVTAWDAIGDLPELGAGENAVHYDKEPFTDYQRRMRAGSDRLQGHVASRHPDYLVKAISFIPDGGNRRDIPPELQPKSGYHNSYSRLHSESPAVAVTQNMGKPSGTRCIHPFQHRGLTAREGARLQGFPDTFHFSGGIISQRRQIANAVPPILAKHLGDALASSESWVKSTSELPVENTLFEQQLALPIETV